MYHHSCIHTNEKREVKISIGTSIRGCVWKDRRAAGRKEKEN